MDIKELITRAESGDPAAQTNLGICYVHGDGVEPDPAKALFWYLKAAEKDEPSALTNAGECYMHGIGTEKNISKAIELLAKASELNIAEAQSSLGIIYITGDGVEADPKKAFDLFTRAAEQKLPEAFRYLGRCYLEGIGTEKNLAQSLGYLGKARDCGEINDNHYRHICNNISIEELTELSANGNANAQCFLGCMYLNGVNVEQDLNKAWDLIIKASSKGESLALFIRGRFHYEKGDYIFARIFLEKAVEAGFPGASHLLERTWEKIVETGTYFLIKILDKKWVDKFLDGEIFMRYLGYFGLYNQMMSGDSSVNNNFRGDGTEGLGTSTGKPQGDTWIDGAYESRLEQNKIFCLYSLDVSEENGWIAPIDPRMQDFGDTAIIILDGNEFLRRVHKAFTNRFGSAFKTSYKRVRYNLDFSKACSYSEFNKDASYAWQREFRISLDLSEKRVSKRTWDSMSDFVRIQYPWKVDNDDNSDFNAEALTIHIGDIRDICMEVPTSEFVKNIDKLIDKKYIPPAKVSILDTPQEPYMGVFRPVIRRGK